MDLKALNKVIFVCLLSGDIKKNHGSKLSSSQKRSIYDRDLNSIAAHDFIKVSLLIAFIFLHTNTINKYSP